MPHVKIKCFSGRTVEDVDKKDWKEQVWDKDMAADKDWLYKKPGYSYD